jgi:hypothetical protein
MATLRESCYSQVSCRSTGVQEYQSLQVLDLQARRTQLLLQSPHLSCRSARPCPSTPSPLWRVTNWLIHLYCSGVPLWQRVNCTPQVSESRNLQPSTSPCGPSISSTPRFQLLLKPLTPHLPMASPYPSTPCHLPVASSTTARPPSRRCQLRLQLSTSRAHRAAAVARWLRSRVRCFACTAAGVLSSDSARLGGGEARVGH